MSRFLLSASVLLVAIVAACSGTAGSPTTVPATLPPATTAAAPSLAATGPTVSVDSSGNFVGPNGLTLYHFDKDAADKSNCTSSQCVANWPALTVASASAITLGAGLTASSFATITGPTGGLQVTFNHVPLYNFAGDTKPGDKNGDGVGGIWHIATAATTPPAASSAPSAAPSTAASSAPSAAASAAASSPKASSGECRDEYNYVIPCPSGSPTAARY